MLTLMHSISYLHTDDNMITLPPTYLSISIIDHTPVSALTLIQYRQH